MNSKSYKYINTKVDMKSETTLLKVRQFADKLILKYKTLEEIMKLEKLMFSKSNQNSFSIGDHLVVKLAISKILINKINKSIKVDIVIPAFIEINRLKIKGTQNDKLHNKNGENFLVEKNKQLEWLFNKNPIIEYSMRLICDRDDIKTYRLANKISKKYINSSVLINSLKLEFIKNVNIDTYTAKSLLNLKDPLESINGGAVMLGIGLCLDHFDQTRNKSDHLIFYTDSDLSTDLGQLGLGIHSLINKNNEYLYLASRSHRYSFSDKVSNKAKPKIIQFLRDLALPNLFPVDTQCGLKGARASCFSEILDKQHFYDFTFDIELITNIQNQFGKNRIIEGPIVWHDSRAESKSDSSGYFFRVKTILYLAKKFKFKFGGPQTEIIIRILNKIIKNNSTEDLNSKRWNIFIDKVLYSVERSEGINFSVKTNGSFNKTALDLLNKCSQGLLTNTQNG